MTITLFAKEDFGGDSMVIKADCDDLRGSKVGNGPRSIKMTSDKDAALLCKKQNYNGEVLYLRGEQQVSDLNDPSKGGQKGVGKSITSVRVTPFEVELNITVVTGDDGTLPGSWRTRTNAIKHVNNIINMANEFFENEKALLELRLSDLTFRADEKRFRMSAEEWGSIPGSWKRAHEIDIVFPDTVEKATGRANFPWQGKFCLVSARRSSVEEIARTFVHELGHYWGLEHETKAANIMTQSGDGNALVDSRLRNEQIEEIQQKLARNLTRQGERVE